MATVTGLRSDTSQSFRRLLLQRLGGSPPRSKLSMDPEAAIIAHGEDSGGRTNSIQCLRQHSTVGPSYQIQRGRELTLVGFFVEERGVELDLELVPSFRVTIIKTTRTVPSHRRRSYGFAAVRVVLHQMTAFDNDTSAALLFHFTVRSCGPRVLCVIAPNSWRTASWSLMSSVNEAPLWASAAFAECLSTHIRHLHSRRLHLEEMASCAPALDDVVITRRAHDPGLV